MWQARSARNDRHRQATTTTNDHQSYEQSHAALHDGMQYNNKLQDLQMHLIMNYHENDPGHLAAEQAGKQEEQDVLEGR